MDEAQIDHAAVMATSGSDGAGASQDAPRWWSPARRAVMPSALTSLASDRMKPMTPAGLEH
jgi:hypothetical protein